MDHAEHITLYQPVWDVPGDYYLIMASTFETEIFGGLSLVLKHEYPHDDSPPEGVVRDDQFVSVGFHYVFRGSLARRERWTFSAPSIPL